MERMNAVSERDTLTDCGRDDLDVLRKSVASRLDLFKRIKSIFVSFVSQGRIIRVVPIFNLRYVSFMYGASFMLNLINHAVPVSLNAI